MAIARSQDVLEGSLAASSASSIFGIKWLGWRDRSGRSMLSSFAKFLVCLPRLIPLRFLRDFNAEMEAAGRHVILLSDNCPSHLKFDPADYPNVRVVFFAPNMTPFIQPLDAGIIRCFKAHYRRAFCLRAIELDDAGERDIYKVNLLEVMLMAQSAWDAVSSETIANCWKHTQIEEYKKYVN